MVKKNILYLYLREDAADIVPIVVLVLCVSRSMSTESEEQAEGTLWRAPSFRCTFRLLCVCGTIPSSYTSRILRTAGTDI